jgi:hypothetical protein
VLCDPLLLRVNKIYARVFRPVALKNAQDAGIVTAKDYLWRTYRGEQQKRMGRCVTKFFKAYDLHITVTQIRALTETTARKALLEGVITPTQREAIMSVNGHSSKTTKEYYILTNRKAEASHGRAGFSKMVGLVTPEQLPVDDGEGDNDNEQQFQVDIDELPIHFGENHPQRHKTDPRSRAKWTKAEITYVGKWVERKLQFNPDITNIIAKCLDHIRSTPACHSLFHPRHVLDSARLKHGVDRYEHMTGKKLLGSKY